MFKTSRRMLLCGTACLLLSTGGCGGKNTHPVSGTVKYSDGTPLPKGMIMFDSGKTMASGEVKDGAFTLTEGAAVGDYKVFFGGDAMGEYPKGKPLVTPKHSNLSKTDLKVSVKAETNNFDITVDKPKS